jgi:hypothetical protein
MEIQVALVSDLPSMLEIVMYNTELPHEKMLTISSNKGNAN